MIRFSVIVPVYRAADTLERCVRSICAQTVKELEIILVDDGSPDHSGEVCQRLAEGDSRIRVIRQENGGPSRARNTGLAAAQGEWILFCDADDEMLPDACQRYLEAAEGQKADVIIADIRRRETDGRVHHVYLFRDDVRFDRSEDVQQLILLTMCYQLNPFADGASARFGYGGPWNKAFRGDLVRRYQLRFPEDIRHYEDRLFAMQAYQHASSVGYIPEPVYVYYATEASVTRGRASDIFELNERIWQHYHAFLADSGIPSWQDALHLLVVERLLFAVQNAASAPLGPRELLHLGQEVRRQCLKTPCREALRHAATGRLRTIDRVMAGMLRCRLHLVACMAMRLKNLMKR